jgi:hypothetical protein
MWEPFAALRYQNKPVDIVVLDGHEHLLTNPAALLQSHNATVDWFRFWLQGYEDPAPEKVDQYRRWEGLVCVGMVKADDHLAKEFVPSDVAPHEVWSGT